MDIANVINIAGNPIIMIIGVVVSIVVFIGLFFLIRELVAWYYKINRIARSLDDISRKLDKLDALNNMLYQLNKITPVIEQYAQNMQQKSEKINLIAEKSGETPENKIEEQKDSDNNNLNIIS
jgi:biopolymer transport protein ExbB/TolQ